MARDSITTSTIDDDADPPPPTLSRVGGSAIGLPDEDLAQAAPLVDPHDWLSCRYD